MGKQTGIRAFLLHLHPKQVDERAIKFTRTFGLGGINALLFVILAVSGLLLRFAYIPSQVGAYDSILALQNNVSFGSLLRNLHHWSAMLMVVTAFLHLLRVFYSISIFQERRKNWFFGLGLMLLVLFSNFTGYLLPWDQLSYWAVTIMTNMLEYFPVIGQPLANLFRGGDSVNEQTLLNFFTLHTGLLPLLFVVFSILHIWQVRKAKGVTVSDKTARTMVPAYPNLVWKEIVLALLLIALLLVFSMFVDAPLQEKANPAISPNPSKAPWYFMGFQEMLMHIHPFFAVFVIPVIVVAFLCYVPYFKYQELNIGQWFHSAKGKKLTIVSILFSCVLTLLLILISDISAGFQTLSGKLPLIIITGLIPFFLYFTPMLAFLFLLKKQQEASRIELIIAFFTIITMSYLVMMFVGILLRGKNMELIFFQT
ncbi:MAG: cytochrome b N-terminal domain-containing protein [Bacteroidales bacterium]|nr:cytochrome b N-terminal domain-containing protein [Bacteroidales bacterium]MCF8458576.1 cytochrome b N-terminal domain-containing protein [Bacteroidales bacterium]